MKKLVHLLCALLIMGSASAQAPAVEWQQMYGGSNYEYANSIKQTTDGGYIIAGSTSSNDGDVTGNNGGSDYWLIKINNHGIIEWQKTFGGSYNDFASDVIQTNDGGYIIAGYSNSNDGEVTGNHGNYDYWIVKTSSLGVIQWQKTFGGGGNDYAKCIRQTSDDGYIVAGTTSSPDGDITYHHGSTDIWIVKLSNLGVLQWQKTYGGSADDDVKSIQKTLDGGYILAGYTSSTDGDVTNNRGNDDFWIVKLSATGNIQWQKTFGGSSTDRAESIKQTNDGGFIVAGGSKSGDGDVTHNNGDYDYWIIKLSNSGNIQWQKTFGNSYSNYAYSIEQTNDGGFVIAGITDYGCGDNCYPPYQNDYWIIKLSNVGNLQMQKTIEGAYTASPNCFQQTADGGYIIALNVVTAYDVWPFGGYWYPTDIDIQVTKLTPEALATNTFSQNSISIYPNPVNDILHINNHNNLVLDAIRIIDMYGKIVHVQNYYSTEVNIENLSKGLYIIEIQSGQEKYTSKFIKD